ncbi:hypothetical protein [Sphingomonas sp. MA1305]|uniref:hypothetical protein n=1 Tax=Sphingomonas sp. MA1305 TaxID=2479204 RepID=UPI0018E02D1F|nr:hypothetical protein [Sphingomonas sp. MA1305]
MLLLAAVIIVPASQNMTSPQPRPAAKGRYDSVSVARLIPMKADDVRKLANGCLDEGTYPADAGPLCFYPDGRATRYGGWGNANGRYEVLSNKIVITYHNYVTRKDEKPYSLSFYHDRRGRTYYRYDRDDLPYTAFPLKTSRSSNN